MERRGPPSRPTSAPRARTPRFVTDAGLRLGEGVGWGRGAPWDAGTDDKRSPVVGRGGAHFRVRLPLAVGAAVAPTEGIQ